MLTVKVLSASRLHDGMLVWLSANGRWVSTLRDALFARHPEAVAALHIAAMQAGHHADVGDIHLCDVEERADAVCMLQLHETLHPDHAANAPIVRLHVAAN